MSIETLEKFEPRPDITVTQVGGITYVKNKQGALRVHTPVEITQHPHGARRAVLDLPIIEKRSSRGRFLGTEIPLGFALWFLSTGSCDFTPLNERGIYVTKEEKRRGSQRLKK